MSEVEKTLTDAYYWLSMYKSGAITEGVAMEKVKKAIFEQPQLNENQQIVLEWLKEYMLDDSDFYNTVYASKQLYSYGVPCGEESEAFTKLNNRELAQVLEVFSRWAQEQEEE
ncbi:hypothetical protein P7E30_05245 [Enterococcus gallinarum]|uniref:Uncharacterized protein n=1 Tax=Enterococcus gallinarum TaxID=1353 RepID=A0AAE4KRE3_ENTGA|nr:hypothetical protein [Enterococcus gallinarum]MDT2689618.1 hypothetical protein [Enterococcus gallinarum]